MSPEDRDRVLLVLAIGYIVYALFNLGAGAKAWAVATAAGGIAGAQRDVMGSFLGRAHERHGDPFGANRGMSQNIAQAESKAQERHAFAIASFIVAGVSVLLSILFFRRLKDPHPQWFEAVVAIVVLALVVEMWDLGASGSIGVLDIFGIGFNFGTVFLSNEIRKSLATPTQNAPPASA